MVQWVVGWIEALNMFLINIHVECNQNKQVRGSRQVDFVIKFAFKELQWCLSSENGKLLWTMA